MKLCKILQKIKKISKKTWKYFENIKIKIVLNSIVFCSFYYIFGSVLTVFRSVKTKLAVFSAASGLCLSKIHPCFAETKFCMIFWKSWKKFCKLQKFPDWGSSLREFWSQDFKKLPPWGFPVCSSMYL